MTIVTPASPAWHRRARRKRSLARGRIWSSRARGLLPQGKDLRLLRAHHSQPLYSELMGRGGPKAKQWQENGGRGWPVSASQLWKGAWEFAERTQSGPMERRFVGCATRTGLPILRLPGVGSIQRGGGSRAPSTQGLALRRHGRSRPL